MAIIGALTDVIVPILVVIGVGMLLGRRFTLDVDTLSRVSLHGLTPALAFTTVLTTSVPGGQALHLGAAYVTFALATAGVAGLAARRMPARTRSAVMACAAIGNNGNMGLPVALFALGQEGLDQSLVILCFSIVMTFGLGTLILASGRGARRAVSELVRLPVLWAIVIGYALHAMSVTLPIGLSRGLDLLAQAALCLLLIALGISLVQSRRVHLGPPVLLAVGLRVLAGPLLALGVGLALGLRGLPLQVLVLSGAMPTAVNTYVLAREYDADYETVASAVTLSTVASVVGIAAVVALLPVILTLG